MIADERSRRWGGRVSVVLGVLLGFAALPQISERRRFLRMRTRVTSDPAGSAIAGTAAGQFVSRVVRACARLSR